MPSEYMNIFICIYNVLIIIKFIYKLFKLHFFSFASYLIQEITFKKLLFEFIFLNFFLFLLFPWDSTYTVIRTYDINVFE